MILLLLAGVAMTNIWSGCTVTRSNYKTLSLFFDGVPDPDAKVGTVDQGTGQIVAAAMLSSHQPYQTENCDECHKSRIRMSRNDSSICAKCHAGKEKEYEQMHGPVAAQACLWCHIPHESPYKHLLRDSDRKLCGQCHSPELLSAEKVPEHADTSRACLDCHTGHGGSKRFMLRDNPVPPAKTEQPREDKK
ncbi:MAG: cytochrome c3 family protein [Phycisphaerales bacterium]